MIDAIITLALLVSGCGDAHEIADAAPRDARLEDSATVEDAGATDAGAPEPCSMEGATRTGPCGLRCGMESQTCLDGLWEGVGPCLSEGECTAGALETRSTPRCGEETRLCNAACGWSPFELTTPEDGHCTSGETRTADAAECGPGLRRPERCSDECRWEPDGACVDACGGTPRMTPDDAQEICLPSGSFWRGDDVFSHTMPTAEVFVSAAWIDRYPVTNRRYRAAVDAGVVTAPDTPFLSFYTDPGRGRYPVQAVTWHQASAFCAWDDAAGGPRRLPTSAEYEKAARGPSPRMQPFVWDGPAYRCDLLNSQACGWMRPDNAIPDPVDGLPAVRSPYGVDLLVGGGAEWVRDWWDEDYYRDPASLTDPQGPATGTARILRGAPRAAMTFDEFRVGAALNTSPPDGASYFYTFRCARSAPTGGL